MRSSKLMLTALTLALALAVLGCSGCGGSSTTGTDGGTSGGTGPAGLTVVEKDFAFDPASLTVGVGDSVTFENLDSAPHNVSIDGRELGTQNQGEIVTWTAEKAGTFPYSCTIHPSMTGEIIVK